VLNVDLLKLSTPTSVTIAVLGFSLRGILMDLFSGIAMGIERPFDVDDWIEIEGYSPGKVKHTNWRVTKIVTRANEELIIPNGYISTKIFKNYSQTDKLFRVSIDITLDTDVTVHKAERIFLGAANQVELIASMAKRPDAKIKGFSSRGVEWNLRFWIDDYEKKDDIVYQVQKNIVRNMHFGSIAIPPEKHIITTQTQKDLILNHNITFLLESTDIFMPLSQDEIDSLSKAAKKILLLAGENAVVVEEHGESLFIVAEGLMSVYIPQNEDKLLHVANLIPGKIFGEMSLLTGAIRSATVRAEVDTIVYEITKENIQQILLNRPELVTQISNILTQRQMENDLNLKKMNQIERVNLKNSISQKIKDTITSFLKM
jgi:CRP-like cAMP-binding protein